MFNSEEHTPYLYNIRIIRTFVELLKDKYPEIDIDTVLNYAGLSRSELEDDGYWSTQEQADRFHEITCRLAGKVNIAREAGRYGAESAALGTIRQYIFGFMHPAMAYEVLERIGSKLTKGTTISIKKIASDKVEAVYELNPGVNEKPYQCQNRYGLMEAVAVPFTGEYATLEHPECIHEGSHRCRYIITWHEPQFKKISRLRNYFLLISTITLIISSFFLAPSTSIFLLLAVSTGILALSYYISKKEFRRLSRQIQDQGEAAEKLIAEYEKRYSDAELVQEIGKAITTVLDVDELLRTVMLILKKHLAYDCGITLLANEEKTRLIYRAEYGYSPEQIALFKKTELRLDEPGSKGAFVVAFKQQKPYLVNDVNKIINDLSIRSKNLVKISGAQSFLCVPIVYENESLGVLTLENTQTSGPPKKSDLNLLMGIAPQIAISINNVRMFEKMQDSEEKYRVLVESANSIIMRLDTQGRITFFNKYGHDFYGYRKNEIMGRNALGLIIPDIGSNGQDFSGIYSDFLDHPEKYDRVENENIRRNGEEAWVSWSNKAIHDKNGNLVEILCVGNDITARKKAEQEKKSLELQLVRSQKMEAIGTLAGGVAHDLNNILSGIVSYPELLLMEVRQDSPMRKPLEVIKRSGEKAAAIVQDLLTLARRGVSASKVSNLNPIVEEYFKSPEYSELVQHHPLVRFDFKLDDALSNILGSSVHLSKTLMNLVSNAAEAMPQGGTITVSTKNQNVDKAINGYDVIKKGAYVVLSVADSGIGISPEDVKRIFEPFYSKKEMGRSGTGLGMAVIWSTVKDHKGYIDVKTEVGKGAQFDLYFPVTRMEMTVQNLPESIQAFKGTEKILVVDDMQDQRLITKQFLAKLGYQVDVSGSGEEAIEYLKSQKADLVLLDMIMDPGIDGLATYEKILERDEGQRAIILSGFSESNRVKKALNLGAGAYVKKPYELHDLAKAIRDELDKKI